MKDNEFTSPQYREGLKLGHQLATGHSLETAEDLSQYTQQLLRDEKDPSLLRHKMADLMAGMRVADPAHVRLVRDQGHRAHYEIDWTSECGKKSSR